MGARPCSHIAIPQQPLQAQTLDYEIEEIEPEMEDNMDWQD